MVRLTNYKGDYIHNIDDFVDYRLKTDSFIINDNEDAADFLNYLRNEYSCSMREFSHEFMDVDYNLGYSILTRRRNTSLGIFFHILNRLGYSMLVVPNSIIDRRLVDESRGKEAVIKNEQKNTEMEEGWS